jgi:lipopolysaccharide heptosyltransferase II
MQNYKNILIVRTDRIGDVVLTTPAIRALRKAYPQARITILVSPLTKNLVDGNPDINEVLVDNRNKENNGPLGFLRLIRLIKSKDFDLAINFHTKKRTNLLCFLARIPSRLGYYNKKFGFLLTEKIFDVRHLGEKHEAQYCMDVLKSLDIYSDAVEVFVPVHEEEEKWAETFFSEQNLTLDPLVVAVHPGASCPTKKWPAKRFVELIHAMNDKYACSIILVGSNDNSITADEIINLSDMPIIDLTGKTSVGQLASLFKRCHMLISNDSGPVHIADAAGTPVISIFTRNQPGINHERWRPLGEKSRVVSVPENRDISFAKGEVKDSQYLDIIEVSDVLEAVDAVFKLC